MKDVKAGLFERLYAYASVKKQTGKLGWVTSNVAKECTFSPQINKGVPKTTYKRPAKMADEIAMQQHTEQQNLLAMQIVQRIASKAEALFDQRSSQILPATPNERMRWSALKSARRSKAERKTNDKNNTQILPFTTDIESSPHKTTANEIPVYDNALNDGDMEFEPS